MRILIAEDERVSRKIISALMDSYGTIDVAKDGDEAVAAMRIALDAKEPYDLVFLDILMPCMDGHVALEQMRALEDEHGIPLEQGARIVMLTALEKSEDVMKAFNNQANGYIVKPVVKATVDDELKALGLI